MKTITRLIGLFLLLQGTAAFAQDGISGSLEANTRFFQRDSAIAAIGTPQYDNQLVGTEAWFNVNYFNLDWGLRAGIRLDVYNNSNLPDPVGSFTGIGIGRWFVEKVVGDLTITGGYVYDQIGAGIIFRTYEERPLAIDNALFGVHAKYDFGDWNARVFTGQIKNRFQRYQPIVRGGAFEGFQKVGENLTLAPGVGIVNRTMDQASMDVVVSNIQSYPEEDRFVPSFNVYAGSIYNTLSYKTWSWYAELALKSQEAILDGSGQLVNYDGSMFYTSLTYSTKGFGITGQYKYTDHFTLRTSPNETILDGMLNYLPSLARQNTYTLTARYNAATQDLGEKAYLLDVSYNPSRDLGFTGTYSRINNLIDNLLFQEIYVDATIKKGRDWKLILGGQYLNYNQVVYESKGDSQLTSIVPFVEFLYRFNRKVSLRTELQYMNNKEDFGSWVWGLLELNLAPKWSFAITDMWNVKPKKTEEALHYPTIFAAYSHAGQRFTLSYVKQVEGIVCTGGVCRFEPAFSGVRFTINSTF